MRVLPSVRGKRAGLVAAALLSVCGGSVLAAESFAETDTTKPPPVPACYSGTGECHGIFLKAEIGATQDLNAKEGVFALTGPGPKQTTTPVSCGDAGCLYNHLNWSIGEGGSSQTGCQPNETSCTVKTTPGGTEWVPVLVNQNDFPVALFLLWSEPELCAFPKAALAVAASSAPCHVKVILKDRNIVPGHWVIRHGGRITFCDVDRFLKEMFILGPTKPAPIIRKRPPGSKPITPTGPEFAEFRVKGNCKVVKASKLGNFQVYDGPHPAAHASFDVVP